MRASWRNPSCTGWPESFSPARLIVLAGSFRFDGDLSGFLTRVGSVSTLREIRYWSVTEKRWRPLVYGSAALAAPEPQARRADFTAEELTPGTRRHYWVNDSRLGPVIYEQEILVRDGQRGVITTWNSTPVRFLFATIFRPGELRSTVFVEKLSPGVWGIYSMLGTTASGWALDGGDTSFVNRAMALYRHAAGIRTDLEPPAFR